MQIGVEDVPLKAVFKRWLKSDKYHISKHKSRNKTDLNKLEITEKEFFINPMTKSQFNTENKHWNTYWNILLYVWNILFKDLQLHIDL